MGEAQRIDVSTTQHLPNSAVIAALPANLQPEARRLIRRACIRPSSYSNGVPLFSLRLLKIAAEVGTEEARRAKLGEHRVSIAPAAPSSRSPSAPTVSTGAARLAFTRA